MSYLGNQITLSHSILADSLSERATRLYLRFSQGGALVNLEEALALQRRALELRPIGHPDRALSLQNIAFYLSSRFDQLGALSDIEEALALERNALELRPLGHPHRVASLGNVASYVFARFKRLGVLSDLEEALALGRSALELRPPGHPHRTILLNNVATYLSIRFDHLGALSDLEEALALGRSALELRPPGHPARAISLSNVANYLYTRFNQLGALSDLEEAVILGRGAFELHPSGHPARAISLCNVANYLYTRFKQLGALCDLEEALALGHSALELRPHGHPDRAGSLGSLANYLSTRFNQLGELSDLQNALALGRSALELRLPGHPDRAISLSRIAEYLYIRFKRLLALSDLEEVLALERAALELRPPGHPRRATSLGNIASYLSSRFAQLGAVSDIEEALNLGHAALKLLPYGHPDRASSLGNLAGCFLARFKHSAIHDTADLEETFNVYSQLSNVSQTAFLYDLRCAKQWVEIAEEYQHSTTVLAYQTFIRLSGHYLTTLPSLPQHLVVLKQLMKSMAVDAFSACVRNDNPTTALELLEQGRGVFWNQLIRLRSPLDEVIASGDAGKKLAQKFTNLASLLRSVLDDDAGPRHDRACNYNVRFQETVAEIRKLPGLFHFLQPPLFSNLQVAAARGPVIIVSASRHSCDALVLLSNKDPVHIPLQITALRVSKLSSEVRSLTTRAKHMPVTSRFVTLLRELWDVVVFPITQILRGSCPRGSRIWWCPTAEFSLLPMHAAGSYRKDQLNFSDHYISSYTPTLMALIRARQRMSLDVPTEQQRFLVVGQAQAAGQHKLETVSTELTNISECIGTLATITRIQDQDADIARVGDELAKTHFVHFACHGIPDRKHPFESGLGLGDGLLKVEKIMRYDLQNAKFAYLSACHTTVGDEDGLDEAIHLAAAMQFAGFGSVIGTMWAVDDAHTDQITSKFYANMRDESGHLDPTRAALALHRTMRSLFSRSSNVPFDQQILYVHIGP